MSEQPPVLEVHLRLRPRHLAMLVAVVLVVPAFVLAGSVTGLVTFSNGAVADASEVNANFSKLTTAVNDNDARLNQLLAPPTWHDMTFANGWQHYGAGYATAQYSKDVTGRVCLRGLVKNGSPSNATVTTLPVGYRPSRTMEFSVGISGSVPGELVVSASGNVYFESGSSAWSSFDGICFHTN